MSSNHGSEDITEITFPEIERMLRDKENTRAHEKAILIASVKGKEKLIDALKIHKRGDSTDLKNHRPINLLLKQHRLFLKIQS